METPRNIMAVATFGGGDEEAELDLPAEVIAFAVPSYGNKKSKGAMEHSNSNGDTFLLLMRSNLCLIYQ